MKYIDEYRDKRLIKNVAKRIAEAARGIGRFNIMEVCGTHTVNIFRFGLRDILPANIKLLSGPGCPVCVTPNDFLDKAIAISGMKDVIITTFGDMLRVPGSYSSLEKEISRGRQVKIVYSTTDALDIARKNPSKEIVFLGVGFETTAPTVAASITIAKKEGINNYSVLSAHKTMPGALLSLVRDKDINVDGFMLPGHVSVIIGVRPYEFLSKDYGKKCAIAGFEPLDILEAVYMIISQRKPKVEIEYTRFTEKNGNALAKKIIDEVFEEVDSVWRGIGLIKNSGLKIRKRYKEFDADFKFRPKIKAVKENSRCICGEVLKGLKRPVDCALFGKSCRSDNPIGSCMVSSEGACSAYYKYSCKQ